MPRKKKLFQTTSTQRLAQRFVDSTAEREESMREMVARGRLSHLHTSNSAFESQTTGSEVSPSTLQRAFQYPKPHPKPLDSTKPKQTMGLVWPDGTPSHRQRTSSKPQIQRSALIQRNGNDDDAKQVTTGGGFGVQSAQEILDEVSYVASRLSSMLGDDYNKVYQSCLRQKQRGVDLRAVLSNFERSMQNRRQGY